MKKTSILSLILVLALCVGLLAGCGGKEPEETTEKPTETTTEATEESTGETTEDPTDMPEYYGDWFIMADSYDPEGITSLQTFYLPDGADTCKCYSFTGTELFDAAVTWYDGAVELDLDSMGTAYFIYDGQALYDTNDLTLMYVRTEDPDFPELVDCEGLWVLDGDPTLEDYLLFEDTGYSRFTQESGPQEPEKSGNWVQGTSQYMLHTGEVIVGTPVMEDDFIGPVFYPFEDGNAMFVYDSFGYLLYIREDAELSDDEIAGLQDACFLLNHNWMSEDESESLQLVFHPAYFEVVDPADPGEFAMGGTWETTSK